MSASRTASANSDRPRSITFGHTGFITPDIERSVAFWSEVLGFRAEPIGERSAPWLARFIGVPGAHMRLVHLYGHGAHIEFIEFVSPEGAPIRPAANQPGTAHVCLRVTRLPELRQQILDAGGSLQGEISEITEGIAKGLRGLFMRDPHGILIELVEVPEEDNDG
ncbi:Glyoxalase/bleomycin resistance protein/dioxygenase [Methylobacterium nodulans ORS 2060]|uniref:Glyoxalase/bleomycin resistance protein/dioxygenase n=2 Tax=Methylobacterium nodulans TaxID=114616 RepID=B8IQJ2_METNO|nr:Glyoxalase/bleomycin resistance protein/dioxygenase [Methylobacterium nodulans ORS 2060]